METWPLPPPLIPGPIMNSQFSHKKQQNPRRRLRQRSSRLVGGVPSKGRDGLSMQSIRTQATAVRAAIYRLPTLSSVLPDRLRARFRWVHEFTMTSTNAPQTATFKVQGNGPGHPVLGTNTHAPYGWMLANTFYEYYYCHGSSLRLSVAMDIGGPAYAAVTVRPQPSYSNSGTTTDELEYEKENTVWAQIIYAQVTPVVLTHSCATQTIEGPFAQIQNQNYCSATTVGTVPSSTWTWLVQGACSDEATPVTFTCIAELDFDVTLFQKVTLSQSADH
jgi:hypothetical protein